MGEVDTLEQRLHKSKSWTDSVGASINWLQESLDDRINAVSNDGVQEGTDLVVQSNNPSLNIPANTDCLLIINTATPIAMMLSKPAGIFVQADADAWNALPPRNSTEGLVKRYGRALPAFHMNTQVDEEGGTLQI